MARAYFHGEATPRPFLLVGKRVPAANMTMEAADEVFSFDASCGHQAREWLTNVYSVMEKMPAGPLFALLNPDVTVLAALRSPVLACCQ